MGGLDKAKDSVEPKDTKSLPLYCRDGCHTWGMNGEVVCRCGGSHDAPIGTPYLVQTPIDFGTLVELGASVIAYNGGVYDVTVKPHDAKAGHL